MFFVILMNINVGFVKKGEKVEEKERERERGRGGERK